MEIVYNFFKMNSKQYHFHLSLCYKRGQETLGTINRNPDISKHKTLIVRYPPSSSLFTGAFRSPKFNSWNYKLYQISGTKDRNSVRRLFITEI